MLTTTRVEPRLLYDGVSPEDALLATEHGPFSIRESLPHGWPSRLPDAVVNEIARGLGWGVHVYGGVVRACVYVEDGQPPPDLAPVRGGWWACYGHFEKQPAREQIWLVGFVRGLPPLATFRLRHGLP